MSILRVKQVSSLASLVLFAIFLAVCISKATLQSQSNTQSATALELPLTFEHHVGDLDDMLKRHEIRVSVLDSPTHDINYLVTVRF